MIDLETVATEVLTEHGAGGRRGGWTAPDGATGQCGIATSYLQWRVPSLGRIRAWIPNPRDTFSITYLPETEHNAALYGRTRTVIDLTARQYDSAMPVPWITSVDEWAATVASWLGRGVRFERYSPAGRRRDL